MEKMASTEIAKHVKESSWDEAENAVKELSTKIMNIENSKEEKKQMQKQKKKDKKK